MSSSLKHVETVCSESSNPLVKRNSFAVRNPKKMYTCTQKNEKVKQKETQKFSI